MKKLLIIFVALMFVFSFDALAFQGFNGDQEIGQFAQIKCDGNVGCSASGRKMVIGDTPTGDVGFQTNLLATGRYDGGTFILQSSSTPIATAQLAYSLIQKRVGGAGGVDETDGGTRLDNGTSGQEITMLAISLESGGTWIITPDTTTGFTTVTIDAAFEYVTFLYVDDTIGWIVKATNATIA